MTQFKIGEFGFFDAGTSEPGSLSLWFQPNAQGASFGLPILWDWANDSDGSEEAEEQSTLEKTQFFVGQETDSSKNVSRERGSATVQGLAADRLALACELESVQSATRKPT